MANLSAPGVYIREIPSGARTITGVSTSLTAFVGRTRIGPLNQPKRIASFADYERLFGGLWADSPVSYAVYQFFLNGGGEALIVRVVNEDSSGDAAETSAAVVGVAPSTLSLGIHPSVADVGGFDHLYVQVIGTGSRSFELLVEVRDSGGLVVVDGGDDLRSVISVSLDADPRTALEGLRVKDLEVFTWPDDVEQLTFIPDDGESSTSVGTDVVFDATSNTALILRATDQAKDLLDFSHLQASIAHMMSSETQFTLTVTAIDTSAVVLSTENLTLDIRDPEAGLAASALVELVSAPAARPDETTTDLVTVPTEATDPEHFVRFPVSPPNIALEAADAGEWGDGLRVTTTFNGRVAGTVDVRVELRDGADEVVAAESFLALDPFVDTAANALEQTIADGSMLIRAATTGDAVTTSTSPAPLTGGSDGAAPRSTDLLGSEAAKTGIYALLRTDIFNILCLPLASWSDDAESLDRSLLEAAVKLCEQQRAMLLVDPPSGWATVDGALRGARWFWLRSPNAAMYYPRLRAPDPLQEGRLTEFPPCGAIAGVFARTDAARGVWVSAAGTDARVAGVAELAVRLTDAQHGPLNQAGVNALRTFPIHSTVVWGARTLDGADEAASEWKYIAVRRLALYLQESLARGTRWAVFEPNGEALWSELRLSVGGFMQRLFRQGAFAGTSQRDAYFVKCDAETTTPDDRARGVVNVLIGFAPLRPAEFVVITLQQLIQQAG